MLVIHGVLRVYLLNARHVTRYLLSEVDLELLFNHLFTDVLKGARLLSALSLTLIRRWL